METPTGPSASIDVRVVPKRRDPGVVSAFSMELPQAPVRKARTIQGLGMDFSMDAPKMSRAVSTKRSQKAPEVEESAAAQALRSNGLVPPAGERKRTVSGQVVPRQSSEDPGAPQRRSVRLFNQIRPTSSKSSSNVPTIGPAPGRELKKA
jgi:anaphase-promoting complex subunit 3